MFSSIAIKIGKMISTLICVVIWEIFLQIYSSKTYTENAIPEQGQLFNTWGEIPSLKCHEHPPPDYNLSVSENPRYLRSRFCNTI